MNVNESAKTEALPERFVNEKAPRTTIAIAVNGTLFLVQVYLLVELMSWPKCKMDYRFNSLALECSCMSVVTFDDTGGRGGEHKGGARLVRNGRCLAAVRSLASCGRFANVLLYLSCRFSTL